MKIQDLTVIFIIIVLPIILLVSYYMSLQIDTINMQTSYNAKLLKSTKEAIEAFEINTVQWNSEYYGVADSRRRDVMASINMFTNSLANNLGIGGTSKEYILEYIPAIAYTLYDGYYIYSPTETKEIIKDEKETAVIMSEKVAYSSSIENYDYDKNDDGKILYVLKEGETGIGQYNGEQFTFDASKAKTTYSHMLKPFIPYTARYKNDTTDTDVVINYTLDNYIKVCGNVNGNYEVRSRIFNKCR